MNRGASVIVGHRDSRTTDTGVFYSLGNTKPGLVVGIKTSAGRTLKYRVVSTKTIYKQRLLFKKYFAVDGNHGLVLISCRGYYDRSNGGYQDSIVVAAEPLFTPIKVSPASR